MAAQIDKEIDKLNMQLRQARIYFEDSQAESQPLMNDNPDEQEVMLKATAKRWEYVEHWKVEIIKLEAEKQDLLIQLEEGK